MLTPDEIYASGVYKCVEKAGGVKPLAEKIGVSRQAVHQWLLRGYPPIDRAIQMEAVFGVSRTRMMNPAWLRKITPEDKVPTQKA